MRLNNWYKQVCSNFLVQDFSRFKGENCNCVWSQVCACYKPLWARASHPHFDSKLCFWWMTAQNIVPARGDGVWWRHMKGRGGSYSWTSKTEESGSNYQTSGFWSCCLRLAALMQWHNLGNRLVMRLPPWRKWRLWGYQGRGWQGLRRCRLQRGLQGCCFYQGIVSSGSAPPSVQVKCLLQSLD